MTETRGFWAEPSGESCRDPIYSSAEGVDEGGMIGIKLPGWTKINVTEIHRTANKELFLLHLIAADRVMHDMGYYQEAKKYEKIIKKCVVILKENY
jgi:hypothetical protein